MIMGSDAGNCGNYLMENLQRYDNERERQGEREMSINHYSLDLPETTLWWTQHQPHPQQQQHQQHIVMESIPNPSWPHPTWFSSHQDPSHKNPTIIHTPRLNLNNEEDEQEENNNNEQATTSQEGEGEGGGGEEGEEEKEEKEPMFEKPLTPSDVGKLNRLVIPKQHAEKYFPLGAANSLSSTASDSGECKGLLLSFEDESGKCWRFRYSYWNSSQSYVLTKGWSRYVKDKRLDAGDVVSFERHRDDSQRLFIRWRRRSAAPAATAAQVSRTVHGGAGGGGGVGVGWTSGYYCAHPSYPAHHHRHQLAYQQQQHERLHAGKGSQDPNQRTRPLGKCSSSSSSSSSKVLRLFGVNMECQPQDESGPSTPECSYNMQSTQGADTNHLYHLHQPPNSQPHMVHQQPYYY